MFRVLAAVFLMLAVGFLDPAGADYLEVRRSAKLKTQPERDAPEAATLTAGSYVQLLADDQTNGYYHGRLLPSGPSGWVYRTLVRRFHGPAPVSPAPSPTASPVAGGQTLVSPHCLAGCPAGASPANDLVVREIYILSNNAETKFADWAAYRVTSQTIGPSPGRNWKADPLLTEPRTLEPADYRGANAALGVDRGHQVPLASFAGTPQVQDTNYLSNITPQKSALNQGPWERLEHAERELARQGVSVHTATGPLYERDMPGLPHADEPHEVPSGYWKVVAVAQASGIEAAAFILEQDTPRNATFCDF
jgi:endonuclease G